MTAPGEVNRAALGEVGRPPLSISLRLMIRTLASCFLAAAVLCIVQSAVLAQAPAAAPSAACSWTPGVYTLGQPVVLEISLPVDNPSFFLTGLPAAGEEWGPAILRSIKTSGPSSFPGDALVKAELQVFAVGDVTLPARLISVNTSSAAKTFSAAPPPVKIQRMLKEGAAPPPPAGLLALPAPFPWNWVVLGALLLAAAVILSVWLIRRRKTRPTALPAPPRVLDPDAWIRAEVERLLGSAGDATARYAALSKVLRDYLEIKTGLPFPDWTTYEAKRAAGDMPKFSGEPALAVGSFLSLCDQVKFAKYVPAKEEEASLRPKIAAIIEAAMKKDEERTGEAA